MPPIDDKRPETRAAAHLPGLDIEIVHRPPAGDGGETIGVVLHAASSFDAFAPFDAFCLMRVNPVVMWAEATQAMWSAWLGLLAPPSPLAGAVRRDKGS